MSVQSRIIERIFSLPPAVTRSVAVTKNLRFPAHDGVELVADLYAPRRVPGAPTLLIRTPYSRNGLLSRMLNRQFAERGFNVLNTAVRGTDGSGGTFDPMVHDRADGLATLDWIEKQPWHNGHVVTFGASYLGYVQFALGAEAGDRIAAMVPVIGTADFHDVFYPGGSFMLSSMLGWTARMVTLERHNPLRADFEEIRGDKRARTAMDHLPLGDADLLATGRKVEFFQKWLRNTTGDSAYWTARSHRAEVGKITAPTLLFGGWQDLVLPGKLADYAAMRAAGREPYLTIGPWTHVDFAQLGPAMTEALAWYRAHITGDRSGVRELPVRLYVQGADEWREFAEWPPPGPAPQDWHLLAGGGLAREPGTGLHDRFRWDPADPTPDFGGPNLDPKTGGRKENNGREARPDVLVYSTDPLVAPLEVIGPVSAEIKVRLGGEHGDVFVRLCDVDEKGRSVNVCDGIQKITADAHPADRDGVRTVAVQLFPTAYRFRTGHRLRLQVCGGSFPRFARNTGTGDPLATAATTAVVDYEILTGSVLTLPEVPTTGR